MVYKYSYSYLITLLITIAVNLQDACASWHVALACPPHLSLQRHLLLRARVSLQHNRTLMPCSREAARSFRYESNTTIIGVIVVLGPVRQISGHHWRPQWVNGSTAWIPSGTLLVALKEPNHLSTLNPKP